MKKNTGRLEDFGLAIGDLMSALLFLFILLLMSFIISFNQKKKDLSKPIIERSRLLEMLEEKIKKNPEVNITIDRENGVLTLRDNKGTNGEIFESGQYVLSSNGKRILRTIRNVFIQILPCYATPSRCQVDELKEKSGLLETVLIEGHTDIENVGPTLKKKKKIRSNLELSARRALYTFQYLLQYNSKEGFGNVLYTLKGTAKAQGKNQKLFGISGYGKFRRLTSSVEKNTILGKAKDRRIAFRFIMTQAVDVKADLKKGLIKNEQ